MLQTVQCIVALEVTANSVTIGTAIPDELEKHVEHSTADAEDVNLTIVTPTAVTIEHVQKVSYQNEIELILYSF